MVQGQAMEAAQILGMEQEMIQEQSQVKVIQHYLKQGGQAL